MSTLWGNTNGEVNTVAATINLSQVEGIILDLIHDAASRTHWQHTTTNTTPYQSVNSIIDMDITKSGSVHVTIPKVCDLLSKLSYVAIFPGIVNVLKDGADSYIVTNDTVKEGEGYTFLTGKNSTLKTAYCPADAVDSENTSERNAEDNQDDAGNSPYWCSGTIVQLLGKTQFKSTNNTIDSFDPISLYCVQELTMTQSQRENARLGAGFMLRDVYGPVRITRAAEVKAAQARSMYAHTQHFVAPFWYCQATKALAVMNCLFSALKVNSKIPQLQTLVCNYAGDAHMVARTTLFKNGLNDDAITSAPSLQTVVLQEALKINEPIDWASIPDKELKIGDIKAHVMLKYILLGEQERYDLQDHGDGDYQYTLHMHNRATHTCFLTPSNSQHSADIPMNNDCLLSSLHVLMMPEEYNTNKQYFRFFGGTRRSLGGTDHTLAFVREAKFVQGGGTPHHMTAAMQNAHHNDTNKFSGAFAHACGGVYSYQLDEEPQTDVHGPSNAINLSKSDNGNIVVNFTKHVAGPNAASTDLFKTIVAYCVYVMPNQMIIENQVVGTYLALNI
jgi:hypothetical protein